MGRMRKEIKGRLPHSGFCSICFNDSLKATLEVLKRELEKRSSLHDSGQAFSHHSPLLYFQSIDQSIRIDRRGLKLNSQEFLKGPLLVDLVGAVDDVGVEVSGGVRFHHVADVRNYHVLAVPLLQVLEKAR